MKKLKYSHFLWRRLIAIMLVAVAVCTAISLVYYCILHLQIQERHQSILPSTAESIYITLAQYEGEQEDIQLKCNIASGGDYERHWGSGSNSGTNSERAMILVRERDNHVILDSSYGVFLYIYREDDLPEVLLCSDPEVIEFFQQHEFKSFTIHFSEIYRDGYNFYPGKVTSILHGGDGVVADFTPENIEQYEYYSGRMFISYLGTPSDSEMLSYLRSNYNNILTENFKERSTHGYLEKQALLINGERYWLYSAYTYELPYYVKADFIAIWFIGIFIGLVLSHVGTGKAYRKYCLKYEMDTYRRNMTTILAHDLKSPLTAISGYAENLKSNVHSEKRDYYADAVLQNVQYMNELITSTLELAKLETHKGTLRKVNIDVAALVETLYSQYRINAENHELQVKIQGKCDIQADKAMLTQALENLISNAVKFTPDKGSIEITMNKTSFRITNDCAPELSGSTDDFCKPFFKGDNSRSDRNGSGIGLATVRNIAALHGFAFSASAKGGAFIIEITFDNSKRKKNIFPKDKVI